MSFHRWTIVIAILGLIGAVLFLGQFRQLSPQASVDLRVSRGEIISQARDYLNKLGYSADSLYADANFRYDSGTALYLELELGLAEAHEVLRKDSLLTHNWHIYFFDRSLAPSQMPDQFNVRLSPAGKVLGFEHVLQDTAARLSLQEDEAFERARSFLTGQGYDFARLRLENSSVNQLSARRDYTFSWASIDSVYGLKGQIGVDIHGDKVGRYRFRLQKPEAFEQAASETPTSPS